MKLLETQPMPDGSLQKRVQITDSFLPILTKITAPMLLISGKYDPVCTKNQIEYIMNNAQNVTLAIFEDSGHFPRIEEAKKYTNTIYMITYIYLYTLPNLTKFILYLYHTICDFTMRACQECVLLDFYIPLPYPL